MWGNYATYDASNLLVAFDKCNNATSNITCKSEAEIREHLRFKYFLTVYNSKQFAQDEFDDRRMLRQAETSWYPMSPDNRIEYVNLIVRQAV